MILYIINFCIENIKIFEHYKKWKLLNIMNQEILKEFLK